jgi:alpha-D-ribose 1-methylphosphonate 5-triphosphate synthase subunit PhnG
MNDRVSIDHPCPARRRWMSVLARADAKRLRALLGECGDLPGYTLVRGPDCGLVMVRGRAGGGGSAFNLGEMTVTRCTVRSEGGFVGHAYVAGREDERALLAAWGDALLQDPDWAEAVELSVIAPLARDQNERAAGRAQKAAATRVKFFAMQTMRT